jgi:hypothetical protein
MTYNKADDTWEWNFEDRPHLNWSGTDHGNYDNTDDINDLIDTYSDLSYEQYQLTFGGTYSFTETFFTKASFTYDIFDMGEEYVYGDEDGTAYAGYVGFGWTF